VSLRRLSTGLTVGSLAFLFAACGDPTGIGPGSDAPSLRVAASPESDTPGGLLYCPVKRAKSSTQVIDSRGGSLRLAGHSIDVPAGAVLAPTAFTISVPASANMEIDISAAGDEHYRFARPVEITISYKRCDKQGPFDFSVWYIDRATGALLERMDGVDDKRHRSVTFLSDHLSGYAIAD
jgi:hypothetical protein